MGTFLFFQKKNQICSKSLQKIMFSFFHFLKKNQKIFFNILQLKNSKTISFSKKLSKTFFIFHFSEKNQKNRCCFTVSFFYFFIFQKCFRNCFQKNIFQNLSKQPFFQK